MMYSAYKLKKQGDDIQPWCTSFPIWNQSVVPCPVLTVASWPAYRFLRRQVRWSGIPISWRIFHSLLWSTQSKVYSSRYSDQNLGIFSDCSFSLTIHNQMIKKYICNVLRLPLLLLLVWSVPGSGWCLIQTTTASYLLSQFLHTLLQSTLNMSARMPL